eukprot:gb/GECG01016831.1/.p1 GENE.gb/GECG01016831.1/~~gb/GECG01016831.1/.p1  ORF type:complete len:967 (+),score=140.49 gb/GECG01016831.1/:1-2901(+)
MSTSSSQAGIQGRGNLPRLPQERKKYRMHTEALYASDDGASHSSGSYPPIPRPTKRPPPPPPDREGDESESTPSNERMSTDSGSSARTPLEEEARSTEDDDRPHAAESADSFTDSASREGYEDSTGDQEQLSSEQEEDAESNAEDVSLTEDKRRVDSSRARRLSADEVYANESDAHSSDLEKQSDERSDDGSESDSDFDPEMGRSRGPSSVRRGSLHAEYGQQQGSPSRRPGAFKEEESKFHCKDAVMTFNIACLSILQGLLMAPFIMFANILFVLYIVFFYTIRYFDHGFVTIFETGMIGNNLRVMVFILALPAYLSLIFYSLLAAVLGSIVLSFSHPFLTNQTDVREKWHRHTKSSALSSGFRLTASHLLQLWEGPMEYATVKVFQEMKTWRETTREEPFDIHVVDILLGLIFGSIATSIMLVLTVLIVGLKALFLLGRCFVEIYTKPDYYGGTCGVSLKRMKKNPCMLIGYYLLATVIAPVIWIAGIITIIFFAGWKGCKAAFDMMRADRSLARPVGYFSPPFIYCWNTVAVIHEETNRLIFEGRIESLSVDFSAPEEYEGVNVYYLIVGTLIGIMGIVIVGVPMLFYWIKMFPMFLARNIYKYFTDFRMFSRPAIQAPLWLFGIIALIPVSLIVWVFLILYCFVSGFSVGATFYEDHDLKGSFLEMGAIMLRIDRKAVAYIRATDDTYGATGCSYALWRKCGHLVDPDEVSSDEESEPFEEELPPIGTQPRYTGSATLWNETGEGRSSKRRTLIDEYGYDPAKRLDRKFEAVRGMRALPRTEDDAEEEQYMQEQRQRTIPETKIEDDDSIVEDTEVRGCLCLRRCCRSKSRELSANEETEENNTDSMQSGESFSESNSSSQESEEESYVSSSGSVEGDGEIESAEGEPNETQYASRIDSPTTKHDIESGDGSVEIEVTGQPVFAARSSEDADDVDEETKQALERSRRAMALVEDDSQDSMQR